MKTADFDDQVDVLLDAVELGLMPPKKTAGGV